jgi:hypothetical protein
MKREFAHYSKVPPTQWPWQSFSPQEIACKGTGKLVVDTEAMDKLQALRANLGKPLILTSAYRSPEHNRKVGGAKASKHMEGIAFDVRMENHDPQAFEAAARAVGFTGFGYYVKSGFMHVDTAAPRSWGKPWPRTATAWPVEQPRPPETLSEDTDAQAVAGAGIAGGFAVAAEHLPMASSLLGGLVPTAQVVAIVVAAALLGYLLYKRVQK